MSNFGAIALTLTVVALYVNIAVLNDKVAYLEKQLENRIMVLGRVSR